MSFTKIKTVKTRKEYHCHECQKTIPIGSKVKYGVTTDPDIVGSMRLFDGKTYKPVKILSAWWCNKCQPVD